MQSDDHTASQPLERPTNKKTFAVLLYIIAVHVLGMAIFMAFRLVLYFANLEQVDGVEDKGSLLFRAMLKGLQFDNVIASYVSSIPLVLLMVPALFNKISKKLVIGCSIFYMIVYSITFIISAADIPYFSYFFTHLGASAFGWFKFGTDTTGMIFQEKAYYPYIGLFLVLTALFVWIIIRLNKKLIRAKTTSLRKKDYMIYVPLTVLLWGLCFLGMRGSLQIYPLRVSFAYFSNNSFFNQLGINPTFFLLKSFKDLSENFNNVNNLMQAEEAIAFVREELNADTDQFPLLNRNIQPEGKPVNANVVVVLIESMASDYLDDTYNEQLLMPYLNELISESYYFENFYSAGIHTNNGIVSTLYGFPPLFNEPMMSSTPTHYTGLPYCLKKEGYKNLFFVTNNPQYDFMNSFLLDNNFERIYSIYDYPDEKVVSFFGVQDDYLFEYGIDRLNEASQEGNPFFATFLTVSNHAPYIIPEQFKKHGDTDEQRILAFVDASLQHFMDKASKQPWFDNTIFVLLGDHGRILGQTKYEMPISYNHIPLILYSKLFEDMPQKFSHYCGQIDVFPTIMGLLNLPYTNNSLGIDVFKEERPCMYFVNDNQLGCINQDYLYVRNLLTDKDLLYDRNSSQPENIFPQQSAIADSLKKYAVSMMVAADYLIKNKLTK